MIVHMIPSITPDDPRVLAVCAKATAYHLLPEVVTATGTHFQPVEIHFRDGKARSASVPTYPFENMEGVDQVVRVSPSLVSIAGNGSHEPYHIRLGQDVIGRGLPCVPVMGPCTIDQNVGRILEGLAKHGIRHTRGGFVKPRSRASSFRGLGKTGLRWYMEAARNYGFESIWTEVIDTSHLDDVRSIRDQTGYQGEIVVWVGARTSNQVLLEKLGIQHEFTVMLKHSLRAKAAEDVFTAAEFVLHGPMWWREDGSLDEERSRVPGNHNLILCVRGLEKTDAHSPLRFYPNVDWISALHERCWTPVCFDPSHISGQIQYVPEVLQQGLNRKPDLVLIEVHVDPAQALCDGEQAVPLEQVPDILAMIEEHNRKHFQSVDAT